MNNIHQPTPYTVFVELVQFIQHEECTLSPYGIYLLSQISPEFVHTANPDRDQLGFLEEVLIHCLKYMHTNTFMDSATPVSKQAYVQEYMACMDRVMDADDWNYDIPDHTKIKKLQHLEHLFEPLNKLDDLIHNPLIDVQHRYDITKYREGLIRFIVTFLISGLKDIQQHPILPTYQYFKSTDTFWLKNAGNIEVTLDRNEKPRQYHNHVNGYILILKKGYMDHYLFGRLSGFSNHSMSYYPNTQNLVEGIDFFIGQVDGFCQNTLNQLSEL